MTRAKTTAKPPQPAAAKKTTRAAPRKTAQGDIAPSTKARALGKFVATQAVDAAQGKAIAAAMELVRPDASGSASERAKGLRAMLEGASADDARVLREALMGRLKGDTGKKGINPDDELAHDWRDGGYPYLKGTMQLVWVAPSSASRSAKTTRSSNGSLARWTWPTSASWIHWSWGAPTRSTSGAKTRTQFCSLLGRAIRPLCALTRGSPCQAGMVSM